MWLNINKENINLENIKTIKKENNFYLIYNDFYISPWHDIPLKFNDHLFNMVCEIPKWTRKKMEIQLNDEYNPIRQDLENGIPREYKWGDMMFNYGILPQTWEDPNIISNETKLGGDNDPLDIIDIGLYQKQIGSIYSVKILGILPMIDNNETDWKIIGICNNDPLAFKLNNLDDIKKTIPGILDAIKNWFRYYKLPTKGILNKFAIKEAFEDKELAYKIIDETHNNYLKLLNNIKLN